MYALQLDLVYEADSAFQEKEPVGINNPLLYHQGLVEAAKDGAKHYLIPGSAKKAGSLSFAREEEARTAHNADDLPCRKGRRVVVTSIFCSENGIGDPAR